MAYYNTRMSRRIVIEGSVTVEVSELAEEVGAEMRREGAAIRTR